MTLRRIARRKAVPMALTDSEKSLLARVPTGLFIGGKWRDSSDGRTLDVEDPSTGQTLASVADATIADGAAALEAAVAAQSDWAATAPRERGEILRRAFMAITARAEEFALLMTLEMGKPLAEARGEVTYGAEFFRWFSEEAVRISGRWSTAPNGATRLLTMKQPVGPTLMITPWNFPLAMGTRKIGPALAAGCTMVVKPAKQTPLSMLALVDLLTECGVPAGVVESAGGGAGIAVFWLVAVFFGPSSQLYLFVLSSTKWITSASANRKMNIATSARRGSKSNQILHMLLFSYEVMKFMTGAT